VFTSSTLRRALLRNLLLDTAGLASDDEALAAMVCQRVELSRHVCGTCKMGSVEDPKVVLDSKCSVKGIEALRVVDASVFPSLMRANTHLPVIMLAEKMADQIKHDWRYATAGSKAARDSALPLEARA
jgi:5-(hydroxymethyl)furfural/furfural oxidase